MTAANASERTPLSSVADVGQQPSSSGPIDPLMAIRGLGKDYDLGGGKEVRRAIGDISFEVDRGEFLVIVGSSGVGKTTLIKCLSGLLAPTRGSIEFDGEPVVGRTPRGLGLVFQEYGRSLFPWWTVEKNVALGLRGRKLSREQRRAEAQAALESVGLPDVAKAYPWQLSGGMQQRVAIARAIAYRAEVLLMDEPFASVDAQTRYELEDLVLQLHEKTGLTVLFVTHDIDEAVYLADRIVVLGGRPSEVRKVIDVPLPRPRTQHDTKQHPLFGDLRTEVLDLLPTKGQTAGGTDA